MAKQNTTTDKDLGAKRIIAEAEKIRGSFVEIGVHEGNKNYPGGASVAEVAFYNEFGTLNIPERSFLRATIDENRKDLERETANLMGDVVIGKITTKKALDKLGFKIQELIKAKILKLNEPPNADSTVSIKGFNNPLVDSRRLWRSIAFESMIKGGKKVA